MLNGRKIVQYVVLWKMVSVLNLNVINNIIISSNLLLCIKWNFLSMRKRKLHKQGFFY